MLQQRLAKEKALLMSLSAKSPLIDIEQKDEFADIFIITYYTKGLCWLEGAVAPSITKHHRMELYMHERFPRFPPRLLWLTDIFHPNILSCRENGGVCIGGWSPSETTDLLVLRVGEMVQYKQYNVSDALNEKAAKWVAAREEAFPVDNRDLYSFLLQKG